MGHRGRNVWRLAPREEVKWCWRKTNTSNAIMVYSKIPHLLRPPKENGQCCFLGIFNQPFNYYPGNSNNIKVNLNSNKWLVFTKLRCPSVKLSNEILLLHKHFVLLIFKEKISDLFKVIRIVRVPFFVWKRFMKHYIFFVGLRLWIVGQVAVCRDSRHLLYDVAENSPLPH